MTLWGKGLMGVTSKGRTWCHTRVEERLWVELEKEGSQNDRREEVHSVPCERRRGAEGHMEGEGLSGTHERGGAQ